MRIISGKYKGKRLIAPKNLHVRPTTDMAKEALFNILNFQIDFENTVLLDLFSGTGNISYEFLSRGTTNITAVDQHFGCVKFINKTAKELDAEITTVKSDVFKYLKKILVIIRGEENIAKPYLVNLINEKNQKYEYQYSSHLYSQSKFSALKIGEYPQ